MLKKIFQKILLTYTSILVFVFGVGAGNSNINISGFTEQDFINTMFLCSEFFENWSDTNYFVNPTLKTSKPLKYHENWYIDFLKDSYKTGIVYNKPSDEFLDLYNKWGQYKNFYGIFNIKQIEKSPNFLKDLTNFVYSFLKHENMVSEFQKMEQNIIGLNLVDLNLKNAQFFENEKIAVENNWKLLEDGVNRLVDDGNKYIYFVLKDFGENIPFVSYFQRPYPYPGHDFFLILKKHRNQEREIVAVYQWFGDNPPNFSPEISDRTGKIRSWNLGYKDVVVLKKDQSKYNMIKNFITAYLQEIINENIRVQQGGNNDYESPTVGTQRIIFDF